MFIDYRRVFGVEVLVCTGAFASIVFLKYFLIKTQKRSNPNKNLRDTNSKPPSECLTNEVNRTASKEQKQTGNSTTQSEELVDHSVSGDFRQPALSPVGLTNLGNTCYINSLLQALSCIPEFFEWLECSSQFVCLPENVKSQQNQLHLGTKNIPYMKRPALTSQELRMRRFFHSLRKVISVLNSGEHSGSGYYSAAGLIRAMFNGMGGIQHYQQDPDELFLFMMNLLTATMGHQESSIFAFSSQSEKNSNFFRIVTSGGIHSEWIVSSFVEKPWIFIPFQGLFHQDLYCVVCRSYRSQPLEVFYSLSLNLPGQTRSHDLEDLLDAFFTPADLDAVKCPTCSSAVSGGENLPKKVLRPHLKRISVAKSPKILCIHIRRAVWGVENSWKRLDQVTFPSVLNMSKFSWLKHLGGGSEKPSSAQNAWKKSFFSPDGTVGMTDTTDFPQKWKFHQENYSLKSVMVHVGHSSSSGHVVAYRKGPVGSPNSEFWYFTNDHLVRRASWAEVQASNPYILFYQLVQTR